MKRNSVKPLQIFSREDLKKIRGGDDSGYGYGCKTSACTWTDANGFTETGTCGGKGHAEYVYGTITMECFCNTTHHTSPTPVGSNGGVSRCYN